jgi:hypothetical protein
MLQMVGVGAIALASGAGVYAVRHDDDNNKQDGGSQFESNSSIYRVGRRYLDQHPEHAEEENLLAVLSASGIAITPATFARDPAATFRGLGNRVRADYAHGRVVDIDGWQLSASEAQTAAAWVLAQR